MTPWLWGFLGTLAAAALLLVWLLAAKAIERRYGGVVANAVWFLPFVLVIAACVGGIVEAMDRIDHIRATASETAPDA